MEDVVVVNEKDEVIGMMPKNEAHQNGTLHRIVVVYIENDSGEFLVQIRADGLLDHSAAGHVFPDESYMDAGKRELLEELEITASSLAYVGHGSTRNERQAGKISSHEFDIFTYTAEPGKLQEDEVKDVYWAKPEHVLKDMQMNGDKYCEGFKVSLPIFRSFQQTR
ncbi:MAG: Isopentenyl-diphosphate Delta-isomerase [Candidatus Kaiserbacteria bacterium]|nr:Isopentenyl-diphosphate Delta-isomerase [Candidatus Kaiserbacteria bacterium]